jgi:hypothetical protein
MDQREFRDRQLSFLSESTIRRAIKKLQEMGLVVIENHNKMKYDRTKWYRVDHEALEKLMEPHLVKLARSIGSNCADGSDQNGQTYTRDYTENTKENTQASSKHQGHDDSTMAGENPGGSGACNAEALHAASDAVNSPRTHSEQAGARSTSYAASNKKKRNPIDDRPLTDEESRAIDRIIAETKRRGKLMSEAGLRIHLEREARAGRLRMDGYCEEQKVSPIYEDYDFTGIE